MAKTGSEQALFNVSVTFSRLTEHAKPELATSLMNGMRNQRTNTELDRCHNAVPNIDFVQFFYHTYLNWKSVLGLDVHTAPYDTISTTTKSRYLDRRRENS